jgi:Do/DeqQ family serine protease
MHQKEREDTMYSDYTKIGPRHRGRGPLRYRLAAAGGAVMLTVSLAGWSAARTGAAESPASPPPASDGVERAANGSVDSYAGVVQRVAPAVVTIASERRVGRISQEIPDHPLLREFFGDQFGQRRVPERREGGVGSGVIVRTDGYILTNHHVVDGAEKVNVELTDGRSFKAKVVGTDAATDLAVLKIDAHNLQTLTLGDSDGVRVGDVVLAVGNPLGLGQTVTMGIVSAKGRATAGGGDGSFESFIQTDAPINKGNSGGALVSTRGELVGINSQILSPSGGNIGIGFAIPANMARGVMTQLIDHGEVRRSMIGVTIQPVTSEIARSLGLEEVRGALVNSVQSGGPAATAGITRGDVIVAINGAAVKDGNELRNTVAHLAPGTNVTVSVIRDGAEKPIAVKLAERQASERAARNRESSGDATGYGMAVEPLTPEQAKQAGVAGGVMVGGVQPSGRAAQAGLRAGDIIVEVDRKPVASAEALRSALKTGDRPALLLVQRGGANVFLTLERAE